MTKEGYIQLCLAQASLSRAKYYKVGAILVKGGKIISRGYNRNSAMADRISKKFGVDFWTLHAEMDALFSVDAKNLQGMTLYVAGVSKAGNLVCSKPCKKCLKIIQKLGIKVIYLDKGDIKEL